MEDMTQLLVFVCLFLLIYLSLYKFTNRNKSKTATGRLPPGTSGWPFIGEALDFLSYVRAGVPEKFVTDRKKKYSSDVFRTSLLGQRVVVFSGAEANKFLFSNEQKLVRVWQSGSSEEILLSNVDAFGKVRKLFASIFKADKLREYIGTMDGIMKQQLETDWKCREVKVVPIVDKYIIITVCRILLGIDEPNKIKELSKSFEHFENNMYPIPIYFPGTVLYGHIKAAKALQREVEAMVKQRRNELLEKSPSPALQRDIMTQMLLKTDENGQFVNEADIASHLYTFLEAGYEATHVIVTMVMKYLAEYPDVYNGVLRATGRLPPGTSGWPVIGEALDFLSYVRAGVPEKFVTDRKKKYSSDVFRTSLLGQRVVVFSGAEANKFLFSNEQKLVRVWQSGSSEEILLSNVDAFGKVRKLFASIFKADKLREYIGTMDGIMKQQLETDWKCREVKVVPIVDKYIIITVCRILLGIDEPNKIKELSKSFEHFENNMYPIPIYFPGTVLYGHIKAAKALQREVEAMVKQRRNELLEKSQSPAPQRDIMTQMLLKTDENGQFVNEADIASHLYTFLEAGYEATHVIVTMVMKYLAEYPDVYNGVLREQKEIADSKGPNEFLTLEDTRKMKYTWNTVSEVLRFMQPGVGGFRDVITDFTYGGYLIPKGWKIFWMPSVTHKDPQYFPDPEKFDPSRFDGNEPVPYSFVPFGGGSRMCPAYEFAKLAIFVFVHNVIINFRWEKLIPNEKVLHNEVPKPAHGLPIRLHPHKQ